MVYTTKTSGGDTSGGVYPTVALPTISGGGGGGSSSSYISSSYYGAGGPSNSLNGGGGGGNKSSNNVNGRLSSPSSNLGLRKRDAVAIFTCLFLLRLAFTPSNNAATSGGGLINLADSSISASMELAFYSPFQSYPPRTKGQKRRSLKNTERTARPVPLDIDGDGVVESMVVPVFLSRSDAQKEKEFELEELQRSQRSWAKSKNAESIKIDQSTIEGWTEDGSWGLRVLNLKPLHNDVDQNSQEAGGIIAGPFAPRSLFLSPLKQQTGDSSTTTVNNNNAYPIKLLSLQIPIQRTHLGEEEKSRRRHKKDSGASTSSVYGTKSDIPAKDDPLHANYERTRHYFCGRDWHHAAQSCHKHCGGGMSSECGDGETCYADTPCDVYTELSSDSKDSASGDEATTTMALTKSGTLPGIATVWSDGSVSLHVITADVTTSVGSDGHRTKRAKQKSVKPELEMRQLWRVYPFGPSSESEANAALDGGSAVDFEELGIAFESGAIYGPLSDETNDKKETRRYGDNGAILLGGRYAQISTDDQIHPIKVAFHALDIMTGARLWELKGNHNDKKKSNENENEKPNVPIIHTTSSARRRSHLPTIDTLDPELDNENAFIEGDDVMTSEECMLHFRASVLDHESGALPHEFWDDGEFGSISVGRFDRGKKFGGKRRPAGKKGKQLLSKNKGGAGVGSGGGAALAGSGIGPGRQAGGNKGGGGTSGRGRASGGGGSWQSDLLNRAVPRRLIKQQRYNARHPHMGKPNVILFHGRDGLAVLSLKNGRPVCHISLVDHSLYADMDEDGAVDTVQVVTSPKSFQKSTGVQGLIQRLAKEASMYQSAPAPVICHALVTSGLPPREEVFTAPLCVGGPMNARRPNNLSAAPPLLLEGSLGYGKDVVFAMNNGVVVRYDFNGREIWRKKGGLKDGTPSWDPLVRGHSTSAGAFLGRVQFGSVREAHSSVSASSHRNQHRPGSPVRPILLSGEDGAALLSPASGKVLFSVAYPQTITSQPLLADLNGDGTDDLLVVSNDAIWGYKVIVETGRSGGFTIVVVTLLIGVALAALVHRTSYQPGQELKRSSDA